MITENEKRKERDYLKTVLYILEKNLKKHKVNFEESTAYTNEQMKYMWKEKVSDELERSMIEDEIYNSQLLSESYEVNIKAEERMIDSAYFARIDFDDGTSVEPIYIGIASLVDGNHFYIYDWRAPICSMFYDAELGEASYKLPDGTEIKGNIVLKRQYVIKGDEIKEIFDTELQVVDSILQKMLSGNASVRMKNIVKTIQKEQNKIIRNSTSDILVVQGPAGSGKTSVALHRIAYLLYSKRGQINRSNVLIISPNDVFSSYISDVLPSVGEDNVYQTTYRDYLRSFAGEFSIKGDMSDIYECLYTKDKSDVRYNSISLKFSSVYYHVMDLWLESKRNEILGIGDFVVDGNLIMGKEFLQKYAETLNKQTPLIDQANMINQKIASHLSIKLSKEPKTKAKVVKSLKTRVENIKSSDLYRELYEDEEVFVGIIEKAYNELATPAANRLTIRQLKEVFLFTKDLLSKNSLAYEDVMNYLLIKGRVQGFAPQNNIKHVVIDEAQDYTILQYDLLSQMFPKSSFTILGDTNQSILPTVKYHNYDSIINVLTKERAFSSAEMKYLAKTYRSTYEINTFAKALVSDKLGYNQVERHGDKVKVVHDEGEIPQRKIFQDAIKQKRKYNSVAIICKSEQELNQIKDELVAAGMDRKFAFVTKTTADFDTKKVQIIPTYIAKGLEFDAVCVYNASAENYGKEYANLFYVCCTRALHKLSIYYSNSQSPLLLKAIEEGGDVVEIEKGEN